MADKRAADVSLVAVSAKRARGTLGSGATIAATTTSATTDLVALTPAEQNRALVAKGPSRSSKLEAPTMLLTGHEVSLFIVKLDPERKKNVGHWAD